MAAHLVLRQAGPVDVSKATPKSRLTKKPRAVTGQSARFNSVQMSLLSLGLPKGDVCIAARAWDPSFGPLLRRGRQHTSGFILPSAPYVW